jgi:hypothetical protein
MPASEILESPGYNVAIGVVKLDCATRLHRHRLAGRSSPPRSLIIFLCPAEATDRRQPACDGRRVNADSRSGASCG